MSHCSNVLSTVLGREDITTNKTKGSSLIKFTFYSERQSEDKQIPNNTILSIDKYYEEES